MVAYRTNNSAAADARLLLAGLSSVPPSHTQLKRAHTHARGVREICRVRLPRGFHSCASGNSDDDYSLIFNRPGKFGYAVDGISPFRMGHRNTPASPAAALAGDDVPLAYIFECSETQ